MKLIILLSSLLVLIHPIHTFCLYNKLSEATYILVEQDRKDISVGKVFAGRLNQNDKKCCHYTNEDCSRNAIPTDPAGFIITFITGILRTATVYRVECTTGGALSFINRDNNATRIATCEFANGTMTEVPLIGID
ncbi:hypothetical protein K501DRAFT_267472 [Backusella circina FSU 941]|nr:hypothetical protein K501DRAFT_267472 [Backusella circina FSU 941]